MRVDDVGAPRERRRTDGCAQNESACPGDSPGLLELSRRWRGVSRTPEMCWSIFAFISPRAFSDYFSRASSFRVRAQFRSSIRFPRALAPGPRARHLA